MKLEPLTDTALVQEPGVEPEVTWIEKVTVSPGASVKADDVTGPGAHVAMVGATHGAGLQVGMPQLTSVSQGLVWMLSVNTTPLAGPAPVFFTATAHENGLLGATGLTLGVLVTVTLGEGWIVT